MSPLPRVVSASHRGGYPSSRPVFAHGLSEIPPTACQNLQMERELLSRSQKNRQGKSSVEILFNWICCHFSPRMRIFINRVAIGGYSRSANLGGLIPVSDANTPYGTIRSYELVDRHDPL